MFAARQNIPCVKKVDFVAFIATVVNCTAQVSKKSKKLDVVVVAAEKFLGLKDFTLQEVLAREDPTSQIPLEGSDPLYIYIYMYIFFFF